MIALCFCVGPGEFASGLTAEGKGGAAGRRFCQLFSLQKKVGRRAGAKPRYNLNRFSILYL
jgi:hypothetical protein